MDFVQELGLLALGSRCRRLSDRLMVGVQQAYRQSGLDFEPRWFPLFRLLGERGPSTVGVCARSLGLTHAAVSQTASALTKRGLVVSRKDPSDERRRLLELSDEGRQMEQQLLPMWRDIEGAVADMVAFTGVDVLRALEGLESALASEGLNARISAHRRKRLLDEVQIVEFEEAHRDDFRRLNEEWITAYFEMEESDHRILGAPEDIIADGGVVLFAKIGEEIVGTCALLKHDVGWELTKMAVTPAHQGKKAGLKLMLAALEAARAQGIERVFLITNSQLKPAIALYRKVGFRMSQGGVPNSYVRGDVSMEIDLA